MKNSKSFRLATRSVEVLHSMGVHDPVHTTLVGTTSIFVRNQSAARIPGGGKENFRVTDTSSCVLVVDRVPQTPSDFIIVIYLFLNLACVVYRDYSRDLIFSNWSKRKIFKRQVIRV